MLCGATGGRRLPGFGLAGFRSSVWPVSGGAVWLVSGGRGAGRSGRVQLAPGVLPPSIRARGGTLSVGSGGLGCDVASVVRAAWGSGGLGCALRARRAGAGPTGRPHSVRAAPSSPLWPRKSFDGRLGSFGSGPGWNLIRWFWRLRLRRRSRLFGWFRLPVGVQSAGHPATCSGPCLSPGPRFRRSVCLPVRNSRG